MADKFNAQKLRAAVIDSPLYPPRLQATMQMSSVPSAPQFHGVRWEHGLRMVAVTGH